MCNTPNQSMQTPHEAWGLASHHPPLVAKPSFVDQEWKVIDRGIFSKPAIIEELDNDAHAAYYKCWHCPQISFAAETIIHDGIARGLTRGEIAEELQIERTALSDLHHHGDGSAANIIRLFASPSLVRARFDFTGWSARNLMGRNGFIPAMRVVAQYHGLPDLEIGNFGASEYELLCEALRTMTVEQLKGAASDSEAADLIRNTCDGKGRDLLLPWLSDNDGKQLSQRTDALMASSTPGAMVRQLFRTWLRPLIHTYYVVEGAGLPAAW